MTLSSGLSALLDLFEPELLAAQPMLRTQARLSQVPRRGRLLADAVGADILEAFESAAKVTVK